MCRPSEKQVDEKSGNDSFAQNKKWVLKARPNGAFQSKSDVELISEKVALSLSSDHGEDGDDAHKACPDDHIVVKVATLSVDAFIRTMLDEEAYHGSIKLGDTIPAIGYGTVVYAGKNARKRVGSQVIGMMGAQEYAVVPVSQVQSKITYPFMKPYSCLGLMGLTTGMTAYVGCFYVLKPPKKVKRWSSRVLPVLLVARQFSCSRQLELE